MGFNWSIVPSIARRNVGRLECRVQEEGIVAVIRPLCPGSGACLGLAQHTRRYSGKIRTTSPVIKMCAWVFLAALRLGIDVTTAKPEVPTCNGLCGRTTWSPPSGEAILKRTLDILSRRALQGDGFRCYAAPRECLCEHCCRSAEIEL